MKVPKSKTQKIVPFEIPFEDRKQTKEIVRLQMRRIALAIQQGSSLSDMSRLLQETKKEIIKLEDASLLKAFQKLMDEILGNWPIQIDTAWNHLESIGRIFAFIDQKTVY